MILSTFFKINLIEKSTYDIQHTACSNSKSPPKKSKTFHKPAKTTFSFTDRQAAIDDGIVEQTSERLDPKRGGGGFIEDAMRRSTAAPPFWGNRSEVCSTIPSTIAACRSVNRNVVFGGLWKVLEFLGGLFEYILYAVCFMLHALGCMLCAGCCMLYIVHCTLYAVCSMLHAIWQALGDARIL